MLSGFNGFYPLCAQFYPIEIRSSGIGWQKAMVGWGGIQPVARQHDHSRRGYASGPASVASISICVG